VKVRPAETNGIFRPFGRYLTGFRIDPDGVTSFETNLRKLDFKPVAYT
jgi:hypothetical protein